MQTLKMFCLDLHDKDFDKISSLGYIPVGLGEVLPREPTALFDDQHAVAALAQAQRRHAAAEAGADNQIIGVKRSHICLYFLVFTRFQTACDTNPKK